MSALAALLRLELHPHLKVLQRSLPVSAFQRQHQHARRYQPQAQPFLCGRAFVEKHHRHQRHQHQAEFVHRRHLRSVAQLQSLEIRQPRCAGGQPRQHQKQPVSARKTRHALPFARVAQKSRQRGDDNQRADKRGEIRIDALQARFGENCRERGEKSRRQRPVKP